MKNILFLLIIFSSVSSFAKKTHAITITGGVSLGVYEAGFLYEAIRLSKKNLQNGTIFTGASAGAMNSFISIMETCSPKQVKMKDSLFWKSWAELNIDDFYYKEVKKKSSILSRDSFNKLFSNIKNYWERGLKKNCKSYLALSVTRKNPLNFINGKKLLSPRTIESFYFVITGKGIGIEPEIKNHHLNDGSIHAYLPFKKQGNFEIIKNIMMASSSFPLAFEPEPVKHCLIYPQKKSTCNHENVRIDNFIDGGVFNNGPLDLAYKVSKSLNKVHNTDFLFFDPEIQNYPLIEDEQIVKKEKSVLTNSMSFIKNFILSSRSSQISNFLGSHPQIEKKLQLIKGELPLASDAISGFFGFFEKDFRAFDFLVGVANARRNLLKQSGIRFDFNRRKNSVDQFVSCYVALQDLNRKELKHCTFGQSNFEILLKVALERLFENCRLLNSSYSLENKLCSFAQKGGNLAELFPNWSKKYAKRKKETSLDYLMRRLSFYKFEFKDLGLEKDESSMGLIKVKEKLRIAIKNAANGQEIGERILLKNLSAPMLNYLFYSPNFSEKYALFGSNSFDFGISNVVNKSSIPALYHRYSLGVIVNGINSYENAGKWHVGLVPYLGYQHEIKALSNPTIQNRIEIRAGYQISSKNKFKMGLCNVRSNFSESFPHCSHPIIAGVLGVQFFDSIKVQLMYQKTLKTNQNEISLSYLSLLFGFVF